MEEHSHKKTVALAIILVIAAVIGLIYYYSLRGPTERLDAAPEERVQESLNALQSKTADIEKPSPLTPTQTKALQSLGSNSATTTPKTSVVPASREQQILDSLQNNK